MDTKTMIHLAVEAAVLSGMTIYFRGKINTLEEENEKLKAENNVLKNIIIEHDKIISLICHKAQIPYRSPILQQPPKHEQNSEHSKKIEPKEEKYEGKPKKTTKKKQEEDEEEGYDTEDLDSELKEEIEEIMRDEKKGKSDIRNDIKREKGG